ncbi:MAG: hypothetical protein ACI8PZ_001980 [Myxococcota bacterium]|jgi:hypothetical protein
MWWWVATALAVGTPEHDAERTDASAADSWEEPLDHSRARSGDLPFLADLPTQGRLGPLRVRVGRQKAPFLGSYIEDLRSAPLVRRSMAAGAVSADRLVGGRLVWSTGPVSVVAAGGHPENLRGDAWDLMGRSEVHLGPVHVGAGLARGHRHRFAPQLLVADRFKWLDLEPRDARVRRASADLSWNPAPIRIDLEAATLTAKGGGRPVQVASGATGLSVMLTGEKRPVDARMIPGKPWDPEQGHVGALELGARIERVATSGEVNLVVDQLSTGLTAHPLSSVRVPLVWSHAWSESRQEDRVMLQIAVDR